MKAAIVNPYLDTLGGGERYTLTFAEVLAKCGWRVDVQWKDTTIQKKLEERFGKDYSDISFIPDVKRGDGYDLCFWLSDGSIPTLRARKNILHFQVPFHHIGGNNLLNKMKLFRVDKIVCNSNFTKEIIDREYGVESTVIYPPVPIGQINSKRKENLIISVGRFSQLKQSKRQDVLIKAFKKLVGSGLDWKLVLAGGSEVGSGDYIKDLVKMSQGFPVEIVESPKFNELKGLYGKAKIFWTASGFGEDEEKNPEKVEHVGIVAVEAMSGGTVPVAYNAGGFKETIRDGENGFLWKSVPDLVAKTKSLIDSPGSLRKLAKTAKEDAAAYSEERFFKEVEKLI